MNASEEPQEPQAQTSVPVPTTPTTALERMWAPVIAAWEKDRKRYGWTARGLARMTRELSKSPGELKINGIDIQVAALPPGTADDWVKSWSPGGRLLMPRNEDQFLAAVFALGAERDVPDWMGLYRAAEKEQNAKEQKPLPTVRAPITRFGRWGAAATIAVATLGAGPTLIIQISNNEDAAATSPSSSPAPPVSPATAAASPARRDEVIPVPGNPVYEQCSDRARSMLSWPGRARGGKPAGRLLPGEKLIVSQQTLYWKYGYVDGDPTRKGWVQTENLCRAPVE